MQEREKIENLKSMKRLKLKTITYERNLQGPDGKENCMEKFDNRVNEFLRTLNAEKIYQISYLNSSATNSGGDKSNPKTILMALITYFED